MSAEPLAIEWVRRETHALRTRVMQLRAFATTVPMIPSAAVAPSVLAALEAHLRDGRRELLRRVRAFLRWLDHEGHEDPARAQRHFAALRLRFQQLLTRVDIFSDALVQRAEHDTGVWISGLDAAARDALEIEGHDAPRPPVLCYLDRGHGAAIRRLRARLPGAVENPVALIRLPRERMIGSGVAASLAHEVGHQVSATLALTASLAPTLRALAQGAGPRARAWALWSRWISEVIADFWAVAKVGVAATQGLMAMLSLPRPVVLHTTPGDPHPTPWIRAKLSAAIGEALFPDPQWGRLSSMWEQLLPLDGVDPAQVRLLRALEDTLPAVATLLAEHRPAALRGRSLREVSGAEDRAPARLRALATEWALNPQRALSTPPTIALGTLGQARLDGRMGAAPESRLLETLLRGWALRGAWQTAETCSTRH